ncbi:23S rRNA (pseudouridine(1915)-N(3))-methyltransferase RlmH [Flavobacteriaceae bacterium]|jgi:23S rRNA (pseudouridine1915-N3)-methyltransferase|nr:23S rRNA (pseudouridine(1915)-N(3))-methyltransferase RlmH [Flavobacteriaceae bacterium]
MKTILYVVGKTNDHKLNELVEDYRKRIEKYHRFDILTIPDIKNRGKLTEYLQKKREGELITDRIKQYDYLVLLDETGKQMDSLFFSNFINARMMGSQKRLIFLIGGPYGFSDSVYKRANEKISLSKMTFSHQMVRIFFLEQLYRANTILRNEPYHHQ